MAAIDVGPGMKFYRVDPLTGEITEDRLNGDTFANKTDAEKYSQQIIRNSIADFEDAIVNLKSRLVP